MLMNPDMDNFMQKFFQTHRLEEVDVMNIEQLVRQYPYYAPLQYLLAKKYRQFDNTRYKHQITKTAIFFSNPHWLNDLLLSDGITASEESFTGTGVNTATQPGGDMLPAKNDIVSPEENAEQKIDESLSVKYQDTTNENEVPDDIEVAQPLNEVSVPATSQAETNMEIIPAELQEDILQEIAESFPEGMHEDKAAAEGQAEPLEPGSDIAEQYQKENSVAAVDASVEAPVSASSASELDQEDDKESSVSQDMDAIGSSTIAEKQETEPPAESLSGELIKPGLSPSPNSEHLPLIPLEPLYAIDYFASQGIKLKDEEGKDKLSQKLRSFTEWLKTMKRIHPEKLEQEMDPQTSTVIQHIAEHSNELEDVVTEAMAEVYARQGLRNKAAEVYQKLSLLNPNKRAYFAARISKLKET